MFNRIFGGTTTMQPPIQQSFAPEVVVRRKRPTPPVTIEMERDTDNINARVLTYKHQPKQFLNLAVLKKLAPGVEARGRTSIRQLFLDVSMVNHHEGLAAIAAGRGVKLSDLKAGDFLLFINPQGNYAKLLGAQGVVVSIKAPRGKLPPMLIEALPTIFNGQPFDYDAALKPILEQHLAEKTRQRRRRLARTNEAQ